MLPPTPPPGRETLAEPTVLGWQLPLPPRDSRDRAKGLTVDTSAAGLAPAGLAPAVSPPVTPPRPIGCHGGACTMAGCAGKPDDVQSNPFSRSPATKWIRLTCYATKEQPTPICKKCTAYLRKHYTGQTDLTTQNRAMIAGFCAEVDFDICCAKCGSWSSSSACAAAGNFVCTNCDWRGGTKNPATGKQFSPKRASPAPQRQVAEADPSLRLSAAEPQPELQPEPQSSRGRARSDYSSGCSPAFSKIRPRGPSLLESPAPTAIRAGSADSPGMLSSIGAGSAESASTLSSTRSRNLTAESMTPSLFEELRPDSSETPWQVDNIGSDLAMSPWPSAEVGSFGAAPLPPAFSAGNSPAPAGPSPLQTLLGTSNLSPAPYDMPFRSTEAQLNEMQSLVSELTMSGQGANAMRALRALSASPMAATPAED